MKKLHVTCYALHVRSAYRKPRTTFLRFYGLMGLWAFCLLPPSLFAQKNSCSASSSNGENKKVFFGVSVGPTVDWFAPTSNVLTKQKVKGGMIAGINLDINITKEKVFYFSTGLFIRYLQGDFAFTNRYDFSDIMDSTLVMYTTRTYQTTYLTVPTGFKFRTSPSKNCVFLGKIGLYHNFRIGGEQFDNFSFPNAIASPKYFISTEKIKNNDAALFAESGYIGLGFEFVLANNFRVFTNVDYSCQFNYFSAKAKSNITDKSFKSVVHSLHIVFGILF